MTLEDIRILICMRDKVAEEYPTSSIRNLFRLGLIDIYHEITVPKTDKEVLLDIDAGDLSEGDDKEPLDTWGKILGEQKAVQAGVPYLTDLGKEFLKACTEPLMNTQ